MRCLVVDDHSLTRDGTAVALRMVDPGTQIFEARSLEEARRRLSEEAEVDLVLLDLDLEDSQGIATLTSLKTWADDHEVNARCVVLSGHCEPDLVRQVVDQLGTGFILKATSTEIFKQAVLLTLAGGVYIPDVVLRDLGASSVVNESARGSGRPALTAREQQVAYWLVRGFTYKRIAKELEKSDGKPISDQTVRVHVGNIAWKLGVTENAKAGVMAEISRRRLTFPLGGAGRLGE
jgi:DNA-binding NarL/FixJ family response regulator